MLRYKMKYYLSNLKDLLFDLPYKIKWYREWKCGHFKGHDWTELAEHWGIHVDDPDDYDEELIIEQMQEMIKNAMHEMLDMNYKEGSNQIVQDIRKYMRAMARCEYDPHRELYRTLANKCSDWTVLDYCLVKENLKKMWT